MGFLNKIFFNLGYWSASNPCTSCFFAFMLTLIFAMGFMNFSITNDPTALWVPVDSRANIEQNFFNDHFGQFFRINTFYIIPSDASNEGADLFQKPYLEMMYYLLNAIQDQKFTKNNFTYTLDDFCYKPISGEGCLVTSPLEYWQNNLTKLLNDGDIKYTAECIPPPDASERVCFDQIGVPVMSFAIFGNITCMDGTGGTCDPCYISATGLQGTFLLNKNYYSMETAMDWEDQVFISNIKSFNSLVGYNDAMKEDMTLNQDLISKINGVYQKYKDQGIDLIKVKVDYLAERSIGDDVEEESSENSFVIVLSYLLMFLYVSISIGFFPSVVHNRFLLGLSGIVVVIFAVIGAIGITFYAEIPLTMISAEVVPFLILAIGVDNMFLISRAERNIPPHIQEMELRVAFALKEIGPSIFTAAFCESLAFFIGMLTDVPALWSFCLVAGIAVLLDFVLQLTLFVPALTLDGKRIQQNRADIAFCVKQSVPKAPRKEMVRKYFNRYFVPFVFHRATEILIIATSIVLFTIGVCSCIKIELGLNQNVSLVEGSDISYYFDTLFDIGEAGPPAYLVFNNVNYSIPENLEAMSQIQIELASLNDVVISPIYSWVAMFNNYIDPSGTWAGACGSSSVALLNFDDQMREFVKIKVNSECCQAFGVCGEQFSSDIVFDDSGVVVATRFRFNMQPLRYQVDYINALLETRRATDQFSTTLIARNTDSTSSQTDTLLEREIPTSLSMKDRFLALIGISPKKLLQTETVAPIAFTYSLFFVYYDQYTYIEGIFTQDVLLGVAGIVFALQILQSLQIAFLIALCVFLIMLELLGCMWMLNLVLGGYPIEMNAVLVVNLITSLGLGVEFCNHVGMAFMRIKGSNEYRARRALSEMGSSVLVGIASTKFIGVIVLGFAKSTIFKLYYFRMYLFIIFLGCFNGLMLLPVLLKYIGPAPDKGDLLEQYKTHLEIESHKNKEKNERSSKKYSGNPLEQ